MGKIKVQFMDDTMDDMQPAELQEKADDLRKEMQEDGEQFDWSDHERDLAEGDK